MEERGIVGPPDGARPRQVLITEAEYENLKEEGAL
jgi:DNA segregation ATPase FtsK/SpoIIIE-like protein